MSDRIHDAEHVLGAMIDFAHEQVLLLLARLAFGDVRKGADVAHGPPPSMLGPLEICKPQVSTQRTSPFSRCRRNSVAESFGLTGSSAASRFASTISLSSGCTSFRISSIVPS